MQNINIVFIIKLSNVLPLPAAGEDASNISPMQ